MHKLNETIAEEVQVHQCGFDVVWWYGIQSSLLRYSLQSVFKVFVHQCGFDVVAVCYMNFELTQILEQVPAIR